MISPPSQHDLEIILAHLTPWSVANYLTRATDCLAIAKGRNQQIRTGRRQMVLRWKTHKKKKMSELYRYFGELLLSQQLLTLFMMLLLWKVKMLRQARKSAEVLCIKKAFSKIIFLSILFFSQEENSTKKTHTLYTWELLREDWKEFCPSFSDKKYL